MNEIKIKVKFDGEKLIKDIKNDFQDHNNREIDIVVEYDVVTVFYTDTFPLVYTSYFIADYLEVTQEKGE